MDAGQAGYLEFLIRIGAIHDARWSKRCNREDFHQILPSFVIDIVIDFSNRSKISFTQRFFAGVNNKEKNHFSRSFLAEISTWNDNISKSATSKINRSIYPIWIKERNIFNTKNFPFDIFIRRDYFISSYYRTIMDSMTMLYRCRSCLITKLPNREKKKKKEKDEPEKGITSRFKRYLKVACV